MKWYKIIFLFVASMMLQFVFSSEAKAQSSVKSFSPDSVKYLAELTTFFEEQRKKEGKEFIEKFTPFWYGGKLTMAERNRVYDMSNLMLKRKLLAFPEFESYLFSIMSFFESKQPESSFNAWQKTLEKLIDNKNKKKFTDYLVFSNGLFTENALYTSASTKWKSSSNTYKFDFVGEEPVLIFDTKMDLKCLAKGDSAIIYGTSGLYFPLKELWKGKEGKVNWIRAGFSADEIFATLNKYKIEMKSAYYKADTVTFSNPKYFSKPLLGHLEDKVLAGVSEERASYPRFESYSKRLKIPNIEENIDYDGGYAQHGAKFLGKGDDKDQAKMIFKLDGKPFLTVSTNSFSIRKEKYSSDRASIKFVIDKDSIIHPGLNFTYNTEDRMVILFRNDEGIAKTPFFNSFHQLDMYFEALYWKIDDPIMEIKPIAGSTNFIATFESSKLYKETKYDRLQGMDNVHPLVRIKGCFTKLGMDEVYSDEIARCTGFSETQTKSMLMNLSTLGYLQYNFETDKVTMKEKLFHYVNAKAKKSDYDVIEFNSKVSEGKSNASINLLNFDLTIRGVKGVLLSDSQKVFVYPREEMVVIKKNRDFHFSGMVNAGKFEFFGSEFDFFYDDFKVKMPGIDSLKIWAYTDEKDEQGNKQERKLVSVIENLKGEVSINNPGNKSGLKPLRQYPIFDSQKDSYVFYQKKSIFKKVYPKDKFYFHLDPFVFDSLNTFPNKAVKFNGTFASAGIFPEFREVLKIQPDYSLGFVRSTPPDGFKMYGDKGKFNLNIKLSNKGLRGDGKLYYLTSTTISNDFVFFPDSMVAEAQSHFIEEQFGGKVEFPPVSATDIYVNWKPYKDIMRVKALKESIAMYDGSKLKGTLFIRPTGLSGKGRFNFQDAELNAALFKFKFHEFFSDTADFKLKALQESALAFSTTNVNAHISFKDRKGTFVSNGGGSFIDFPINQYICFMDRFTWYMDDESIELGGDAVADDKKQAKDVELEGAKFISVHPDQDSLQFYSPAGKYDLKKNIIQANKVKHIPVADALIQPDSGAVVVEKKAFMRPLKNATIIANNITQYHTIYNSNVKISARKKYKADGYYDYVDENKKKQTIHFEEVDVDTTAQTYAVGKIADTASFTLSPAYAYTGDVRLNASVKYLTFDGKARINHGCNSLPIAWMKFKAEIDPNEIYIPIDTVIYNANNEPLGAGMFMAKDSSQIYSSFLSPKTNSKDLPVISANGFMFYDKISTDYKISNLEKLNSSLLPGNLISLNTSQCMVYGDGKMDFAADLGRVKVTPVGNVSHYLKKDSATFDIMMLVDFFFLESAIEDIGKKMQEWEGLNPVNFDRGVYEKGLQELLGKEEADKLISQVTLSGSFKRFPDELNKTFFLTDLKMRWNPVSKSYQSVGPIGIGNTYKRQINKMVTGYVEVVKKRSGDELNIYIELDGNTWYYFNYKRFLMQAISSDDGFNNSIKDLKADKRKVKHEKGIADYQFMLSTTRKKNDFLKNFGVAEE